jgi:twitching motility protein PilT
LRSHPAPRLGFFEPPANMEKLNDYLQQLMSSCGEELRLEPNRPAYLVVENSNREISGSPLLGTQISTMVFPLIPRDVVAVLPNRNEVEFALSHDLGNFNFSIQKSPAGFVVSVRPALPDRDEKYVQDPDADLPLTGSNRADAIAPATANAATFRKAETPDPELADEPPPSFEQIAYELDGNSYDHRSYSEAGDPYQPIENLIGKQDDAPEQYVPLIDDRIEIVPANDPEFHTVFSDTATYEPPGRKGDLPSQEYLGPTEPADHRYENYNNSYAAVNSVQFQQVSSVSTEEMDELFRKMEQMGASDLHLSVSMPPMIRKDGKMRPLEDGRPPLDDKTMQRLLRSIMPAKNQEEFARRNDTDFAYELPSVARFRCNVFRDRKGMGGVFRIIPTKILTAEQLGLSKAIMDLCYLSKGLVVVTGPTGSGKSTTLCAMIDHINKNREDHIITIEDPIEFVHENNKCLVNQREVHNHTDSFKDALRAALREDPDILLVGEMRDLETISIAIETAETGHLVFGTLHTTTAASTVDRIIDQFPADRQQQIRVMLSESLKGVIAQTLLPKKGGGRVAALEVLIVTPAISNLIREGKTFQIPSAMQTGKNHGMVMLNDALYEHVQAGRVEPRDAYVKAVDKTGFETLLNRGGYKL